MTRTENGAVITLEALKRAEERRLAKEAGLAPGAPLNDSVEASTEHRRATTSAATSDPPASAPGQDAINPARLALIGHGERHGKLPSSDTAPPVSGRSKTQQRKLEALAPKPPPPKPIMPEDISLPQAEEHCLALWDLSDDQHDRREMCEKPRKAAERKALREAQKSGKRERRAARDEKRRVYREIKNEWKVIKGRFGQASPSLH